MAAQVFDRKFVGAACAIGVAYAVFLSIFAQLVGPAAAGVAGVALTSVATAIFKQFENLRFRELAESEGTTVEVVRVNPLILVASIMAYAVWTLAPLLVIGIGMLIYKLSFYDLSDVGQIMAVGSALGSQMGASLANDPWLLAGLRGLTVLASFTYGMACGSLARKRVAYTYAIATALGAQLVPYGLSAIMWGLQRMRGIALKPQNLAEGVWAAAYVAAAFAGALVWARRRERRAG